MEHAGIYWFVNGGYVEPLWYLASFLPVGLPVIREAVASLRVHDWFNELMLMVIASAGAFCIGEYPEAVGVMLFYSIGESLQDKAVSRATRNISRLVDVRVEHARAVRKGKVTEVPPADVKTGETIEVLPGQRVAIDGKLLGEAATFDTSALTGESVPRLIEPGGEVLAGRIYGHTSFGAEGAHGAVHPSVQPHLYTCRDSYGGPSGGCSGFCRFAGPLIPLWLL